MSSQYNFPDNPPLTKSELRVITRNLRQRLSPHDREQQSALIVERTTVLLDSLSPQKVGLYLATRYEVNLDPLIERIHTKGVEVYLPHLEDHQTPFHQFLTWESLESGPLDLRQPPVESPALAAVSLDVIIVPGLAFDQFGNRLGHGGGWYDKTLDFKRTEKKKPRIIGVCFQEQFVEAVPCEPFDVRMDIVVTPYQLSMSNER